VLVRPEALRLDPDPQGEAWVMGREFLGREWLYQVQLQRPEGELRLRLRLGLASDLPRGTRCSVRLRPEEPALLYPGGVPLRSC
jgi:iron(III) transport system ATP-binding protein